MMDLGCGAHLPHKHVNNESTCGTVSQNTVWKLAEDLLYNQSCKTDLQGIQVEQKIKRVRTGLVSLGRICKGEKVYAGRPHLEVPCPGWEPLGRWRGWRSLDLFSECAHAG